GAIAVARGLVLVPLGVVLALRGGIVGGGGIRAAGGVVLGRGRGDGRQRQEGGHRGLQGGMHCLFSVFSSGAAGCQGQAAQASKARPARLRPPDRITGYGFTSAGLTNGGLQKLQSRQDGPAGSSRPAPSPPAVVVGGRPKRSAGAAGDVARASCAAMAT